MPLPKKLLSVSSGTLRARPGRELELADAGSELAAKRRASFAAPVSARGLRPCKPSFSSALRLFLVLDLLLGGEASGGAAAADAAEAALPPADAADFLFLVFPLPFLASSPRSASLYIFPYLSRCTSRPLSSAATPSSSNCLFLVFCRSLLTRAKPNRRRTGPTRSASAN